MQSANFFATILPKLKETQKGKIFDYMESHNDSVLVKRSNDAKGLRDSYIHAHPYDRIIIDGTMAKDGTLLCLTPKEFDVWRDDNQLVYSGNSLFELLMYEKPNIHFCYDALQYKCDNGEKTKTHRRLRRFLAINFKWGEYDLFVSRESKPCRTYIRHLETNTFYQLTPNDYVVATKDTKCPLRIYNPKEVEFTFC
jgi:hypothetical protein